MEVSVAAAARLRAAWPALRAADPRLLQIGFLALLLGVGVLARDFALHPAQMALAFAAGLATQSVWIRALGLRSRGHLSAIVTCFGLSILLRADSLWVHPLAAAAAVSSKFVLRFGAKHLFNPANLGVVAAASLLPGAWISPGQWGSDLSIAVWLVALGGLVATRAQRAPLAWWFLGFYLALAAGRIAWLGQPWPIWTHQALSGSLLLFAFFMISDPMTTPDHPRARIVYALVVAAIAFGWQYGLFRPAGPVWALFLATPLVPALDRIWPGRRFDWPGAGQGGGPGGAGIRR